jgi:hypothetical protein
MNGIKIWQTATPKRNGGNTKISSQPVGDCSLHFVRASDSHAEIPEWAAVFTSLLWACAWLASGFLFGFLFGIPKVVQRASDASKVDQSSYRLGVNTNLEEISDWLTKILVGATLTQLVKVPGKIAAAAEFMARGLGGAGSTQFAASLLLYFSAVGFFAGYVLTRMFFQRAFGR